MYYRPTEKYCWTTVVYYIGRSFIVQKVQGHRIRVSQYVAGSRVS